MADDERFSLLVSAMGQLMKVTPVRDERIPEGTPMNAGYTPGVPRLGVPALRKSDASMGVINPGFVNRDGDTATALPASIALASSFNPELARAGGRCSVAMAFEIAIEAFAAPSPAWWPTSAPTTTPGRWPSCPPSRTS